MKNKSHLGRLKKKCSCYKWSNKSNDVKDSYVKLIDQKNKIKREICEKQELLRKQ